MKKLFILTVCTFFIVPSINSISFAEEMMTWGEVISKGKVVATSHADVSTEVYLPMATSYDCYLPEKSIFLHP